MYIVMSKNWSFLGNLGLHIGLSKNYWENEDGDNNIDVFFGIDKELNRSFSFLLEYDSALNDGEIIKSVTFPNATKAAYAKFPSPASRYAMVGVFVAQAADGVRVAVTGATECAHRGPNLEAALSANWSPDAVDGVTIPVDRMNSDIHAGAEYRAHLVVVMAKRAVAAAG